MKLAHSPLMSRPRSKLQEDTYFRVLRILQDRPDVTQREIAQLLGVSTSGLNYCLNVADAKKHALLKQHGYKVNVRFE